MASQTQNSKDPVQLAREFMVSGVWLTSVIRLRDAMMEARKPKPSSDKAGTE